MSIISKDSCETPSDPQSSRSEATTVAERFDALHKKTGAPLPRIVATEGAAGRTIRLDHPDQECAGLQLAIAMGTTDTGILKFILTQLAEQAAGKGTLESDVMDFALAAIRGAAPKDPIELMLITQMQAVHVAAMSAAKRLAGSTNVVVQDSNSACMNKLMRTFAAQVEALKRYRSASEQVIRVERVVVNEGGQAVVGNVTTRGGGTVENRKPTS